MSWHPGPSRVAQGLLGESSGEFGFAFPHMLRSAVHAPSWGLVFVVAFCVLVGLFAAFAAPLLHFVIMFGAFAPNTPACVALLLQIVGCRCHRLIG